MKCPTCHQEIPGSENHVPQLACPRCLADKSYRALLQFQRHFMPHMLKGESLMTLTKPASEYRWHLVLAAAPQAFCGQKISFRWKDKEHLPYPRIDPVITPICQQCQRVFKELAEDRPTEVA